MDTRVLTHGEVGQDLAPESSCSDDEDLDSLSEERLHLQADGGRTMSQVSLRPARFSGEIHLPLLQA